MKRRDAVQLLAVAPLTAAFRWTPESVREASARAREALARGTTYDPKQFTAHEWETVRVLVDLIIPKDERSGSATEAGVPEFMDFMMIDQPQRQTAMRGGLALIDHLCEERFDNKPFVACSDEQRHQILDAIAFRAKAGPELSQAVTFFTSFRDLTASGFWTSQMGVADLQYQGNVFMPQWKGCPEDALRKLGVSYDAE